MTKPYEVLCELEDFPFPDSFSLAGVSFTRMSRGWMLPGHAAAFNIPADSAVTFVRVEAADEKQAGRVAVGLTERSVETLRVGMKFFVRAEVSDIRIRRGSGVAVRAPGKAVSFATASRQSEIVGPTWPSGAYDAVLRYLGPLEALLLEHDRPRIRKSIERTVHWISEAIAVSGADVRVLLLCTALESLLTAPEDRRKGESIAIRSMLLPSAIDQGFGDPREIVRVYDIRSRIVHGSRYGIANDRHHQVLLSACKYQLSCMLQLLNDRTIRDFGDVRRIIENEQALRAAAAWLARGSGEHQRMRSVILNHLLEESTRG